MTKEIACGTINFASQKRGGRDMEQEACGEPMNRGIEGEPGSAESKKEKEEMFFRRDFEN